MYEYSIPLPEIEDDKDALFSIEIKSDLGNTKWTNSSGVMTS
jgi:hypothetical protein